jgi:glycosyltransferase involved in cell wall biosynthesis
MKILHIVKSLGRGGAEMLLQETLKIHRKDLFEFHYIYFLPWKNQMVDGLTQAGGLVENVPAKNNIAILFRIPALIRYVRKHKIQVIHCHLPWAGIAGRIIHKMTGVPVLYTEHNIQERYHFLTRFMNRFTFNWQSKAIAVSADVAQSIQTNIKPAIPVDTILNGVNTASFQRNDLLRQQKRADLGVTASEILIGTIAVFRQQKRIKEWLEVIAAVHKQHPNIKACIVGDGPMREEIMAHVRTLHIEHVVHFAGLQSDVMPWLSAFDIFMMTSAFEGLPIALLEAMSMGCAIVTTDVGGIKELVRHGEEGLMESADNWRQLAVHVEYFLQQPDQMAVFGARARQRVEAAFSMKQMVALLENHYVGYQH